MAKYTMKSPMRTIVSNASRATWNFIHAANAQNLSYRLNVNEFADLSTCESVSQYAGYKPNNVWSGLEHLRTHEYVGEPLVDAEDWTTKGGDASEEPGAVWLVLGFFDHEFSRR